MIASTSSEDSLETDPIDKGDGSMVGGRNNKSKKSLRSTKDSNENIKLRRLNLKSYDSSLKKPSWKR